MNRAPPPGGVRRATTFQQGGVNSDPHASTSVGERRDKPLSFHWRAERLEWLDVLELPPAPTRNYGKARAAILLDALQEAVGYGRWISYSRNNNWYARQQRYNGTAFTRTTVIRSVDETAYLGWNEHEKAPPGVAVGWQSRFRASRELITAVVLPKILYDPIETIRLKDNQKHLVGYRDTDHTVRMRHRLASINEAIADLDIALDAPDVVVDGPVLRCGDHVLYPARNQLHRVFNGSWDRGGRFYGGWWQNVKSRCRPHLRMNGNDTIEIDYPSHHPRLIYRMEGKILDVDAYDLNGWDRSLCKVAFNVLLNAGTRQAAIGAIANAITAQYGPQDARTRAVRLMEAMKRRHTAIARHFHTGIGLRLQNLDSRIAERVVLKLLNKGIVALPIHDSFVVPANDHDALAQAMDEALKETSVKANSWFPISR